MDDRQIAGSTLADLRGVAQLYLRRQLSLMALRVNFERAATRLRLLDPEGAEVLRSFADLLDRIAEGRPAREQHLEVARVLDRFDYWARGAAA
jgi:hypothetical protein